MLKHTTYRRMSYYLVALFSGLLLVYVLLQFLYATELPDFGLLVSTLLYGAILEEVLKFCVVYALYRLSQLPLVALFVGLGYGTGERLLYWLASGTLIPHDLGVFLMHACAGLVSFHFLNKHKVTSEGRDLMFAISTPIIVHGVYNLVIWSWYWWVLLSL